MVSTKSAETKIGLRKKCKQIGFRKSAKRETLGFEKCKTNGNMVSKKAQKEKIGFQ